MMNHGILGLSQKKNQTFGDVPITIAECSSQNHLSFDLSGWPMTGTHASI
jgi:hypothetical protein